MLARVARFSRSHRFGGHWVIIDLTKCTNNIKQAAMTSVSRLLRGLEALKCSFDDEILNAESSACVKLDVSNHFQLLLMIHF